MKEVRNKADTLTKSARKQYLRNLGMREESSWLLRRLSPSLDVIRGLPPDSPHACCQGLVRMSQNLLINYIIRQDKYDDYSKAFSRCPVPPGWHRIQNPIRHRGSWDLSEQARACVVTAIVCRTWLSDEYMRPQFRTAVRQFNWGLLAPWGIHENRASAIVGTVFSRMAASYGLVTRHALSDAERVKMAQLLDKSRRAFVQLVSVVTRSQARSGSIASSAPASVVSLEPDLEADEEEGNTDAPGPATQAKRYTENLNAQLPAKSVGKWAKRSNVHVSMHYSMAADYFATMWNVSVLPGESFHRIFKAWVGKTNHKNVELVLLRKDCRFKAIKFVLGGAFSVSHPRTTSAIQLLRRQCPALMEAFLPPSSHEEMQPYTEDEDQLDEDDLHVSPRVQGKLTRHQTALRMLPTRPNEMGTDAEISRSIDACYVAHYGKKHALEQNSHVFRYWRSLTFIDPTSQRRIGFSVNSYVRRLDEARWYGQIQYIVTHRYGSKDRVFLVCHLMQHINNQGNPLLDPILRLPVLFDSKKVSTIGLNRVHGKRPFFIPTEGKMIHPSLSARNVDIQWLCDWDVNYG